MLRWKCRLVWASGLAIVLAATALSIVTPANAASDKPATKKEAVNNAGSKLTPPEKDVAEKNIAEKNVAEKPAAGRKRPAR